MITLDQAGVGVSATLLLPPPRKLQHYAEHGFVQTTGPAETGGGWRIVPDPNPHLIVPVLGRTQNGEQPVRGRIVGARSRFTDIDRRNRLATVGVRLRPGVLPLLLRDSARLLTDQCFSFAEVFGREGREFEQMAGEVSGAQQVLSRLFDFLLQRVRDSGPIDWRVRAFTSALGSANPTISGRDLRRSLGVAERSLRHVVGDHVGLCPRRIASVYRLHRAIVRALANSDSWSRVACEAGYYDQPHMVREFRALLGETPRRYLERAAT